MFKIQKGAPFYSTLLALSLFGQIPVEFKETYSKSFLVKCILSRFIGFVLVSVAPILQYVMATKGSIEVDISENISITISSIGALLTGTFLTCQYKKWLKFFEDITDHKAFGKPPDYEDLVKNFNRFSAFYTIYCTGSVPVYAVTVYFNSMGCDEAALKAGFFCKSFTPIWLPIDGSSLQLRVIIYIVQMLLGGTIVCTSAVINFMVWESTEMLISHINSLKIHFNKISEKSTDKERSEQLGFCVRYHNHILRLSSRLNGLIKWTSGHMSLTAALIFASIGNQISNSKSVGAFLYLIGYVGALFFICHAGQRIKDELMSVGDAVYNADWYATDVKTIRSLRFIIARCQIPFHYEAIPLGVVDYPLFLMIIKTSYSYVTLLSQTT